MLDSDHNTLPEDSVPDLRGVVHRLQSFDRFLGQTSSKDLDDVVIADHNQSLLDLHESCMFTVNKSNAAAKQTVKHDGILEKILAKPVTPMICVPKETSSSKRSATTSRLPAVLKGFAGVRQANVNSKDKQQGQEHSLTKTLFAIGEELGQKKSPLEMRGAHSRSFDGKDAISHKSTSPRSTSRNQMKRNEMFMNEHDNTKVVRTEEETQNVPKIASSPSLSKVPHHQPQRRGVKADLLSLSLHSESNAGKSPATLSKRPHSRQGLYSSLGRRSEHGDSRTTKSKHQDPLTSKSEHVPTSRSKARMALERKNSSRSISQSSTLNEGEEESRGQSRSPSFPRPRPHARRARTISPKREVDSSSKDGHDEKKGRSHRSQQSSRKPPSEILRARSTQGTSPPSRRTRKPSSSSNLSCDGEQPLNGRSRSSEDIAHQTGTSSRGQRLSTSRRRLKSRGSQGELDEQSRQKTMKQRDSLQSFFGTNGGAGIITPATQVKRLASAGELCSKASLHNATPASNETKPSITPKTMNNLMLDLRRQTGQNLMQKFKPTRDLQAGIMDDVLT